jgi:dipeptidyl aminopeptidase/acylaminoacyl peptidase
MRCLLVTLVLILSSVVLAQDVLRTHDVVPDDYFTLNAITEIAVSPDGKHVAYCLGTWDKTDDSRKTDLWVVPTDGKGKPTRLTFDRANDRHPKWSGDGKAIYFLGNRKRAAETAAPFDGKTQVWRIDAAGGDPKTVTREVGGISGYDYAPKADAIFFSKDTDHADDDAFAKLRAKFDKVEYGHGKRKVSEIHKLDVTTWRTERVVAEKRYVREFAVTQDGKKIAMISAFDDTVVKSEGESRVDIYEPRPQGSGYHVTTPPTDAYRKNPKNSPHAWLENLCWSHDGLRFAFTAVHDAFPAEVIVGLTRTEGWEMSRVDRKGKWEVIGYGRGAGTSMTWDADDLVLLGEVAASSGTVRVRYDGDIRRIEIHQGYVCYSVSNTPAASSVVVQGFHRHFPQLRPSPSAVALLDPNPHTATWKLPTVQHITWKAPDGSEVGGVLELPFGYKRGDKLPLVVAIHGGPTTSTKADLNFDPHNGRLYFAAAGYAVLLPNYRGSTGYGDKFVTDLIGNENDIEVKDILAGIQHLVKEGIADPDRVGCMGWSNGGYLTNCLITLKDSPVKFKAASSGAGIVDTVAEWGFNDEPAYPVVFKKGTPWEQPEIYKKTSPTYGLGNVTTPTLIHVGGNDVRCPPGHSWMLYRALKEYKQVPTELVVYTGEPHGLTKMSNRKAKMEWDLAWFEKYLKK